MMRTFAFVAILCLFPTYLLSEPQKWGGYIVTILGVEKGRSIQNQVMFKSIQKKKITRKDKLGSELIDWGIANMGAKKSYYVVYKRRLPSGKKTILRIYYKDSWKVKFRERKFSPYLKLEVKDLNRDGDFEVVTSETRFLRPTLQRGNAPACRLPSASLAQPLPAIYAIRLGKLKEVTFERRYIRYLYPGLKRSETMLRKNQRMLWKSNMASSRSNLRMAMSYYYYMSRLGKEKRALAYLRKSKITAQLPCFRKKRSISLYRLFLLFRQNMLWGSE
ncbi:MAG: hypothetical protein AAF518_06240 [Spirochaetota bacterium]